MKRYLPHLLWFELSLLLLAGEGIAWWRQAQHTLEAGGTPRDTLAFYTGALIVARGDGEHLYDLSLQQTTQQALLPPAVQEELQQEVRAHTLPFVSPPFVALLFLPLTLFPLSEAHVVWGALNWMLLFLLSGMLVFSQRWTLPERLVAFGASVSFAPAYYNIAQGQVSLFVLWSAAGSWALARRNLQIWSGLGFSFLLLKPQYALIVLLFLLVKQRWRILVGFGMGAAALTLVSAAMVGVPALSDYVHLLAAYPRLGADYGVFPEAMTSWSGLIGALFGERSILEIGGLALMAWILVVGATVGIVLWCWRAPLRLDDPIWGARYVLVIIAATLVSPHVNIQDLTWLILAGLLIWDFQRPSIVWAVVLLVMQMLLSALYALYVISPLHWNPPFLGVPALSLLLIALIASIEWQALRFKAQPGVLTTL